MATDPTDSLQLQVQQLQKELSELKKENAELKRAKNGATPEVGELPVAVSEFEETLRRLVQRTAMIVQAEKCVIMVRDRETGDLYARPPAFGMTEEEVKALRCPQDKGISGEVFRAGRPGIFLSAEKDPRACEENLPHMRIRNGVTVPLVIEKRDDENHIVDRLMIGVLHCFNKRYGGEFIDEDVRLLERLSRNASAVIANAQMFQEIFEEKQKLVHTLESLTAGVILINQRGLIGQMNAQARAMFGVPTNLDRLGKPYQDVIRHEEALGILKRQLEESINPANSDIEVEGKKPDEITITDKDNTEFTYQMHAACVRDDTNTPFGVVVIFNDITDIRNVERMKTEFVSIVSHELRTPLTPMKGFVRTLLDDENEEWYAREDRREFYGIIDQSVDRLGRLIDDLLNISRIERGVGLELHWEPVDIRDAAETVAAVQRGRTEKHTIVVDFEPEHITADTDRDKIQNVLHNILSNAIKYSPDGGEIHVIGRIEPAMEERPESVLVGIRDQGMGLTPTDLKKIGDKFFRTEMGNKQKITGTGIGLYLVKGILEAHQGQMWPESEGLGKGTTFWFRFPIKRPEGEEGVTVKTE